MNDKLGRTISKPRDLSKTHRRVMICAMRPAGTPITEDRITYIRSEALVEHYKERAARVGFHFSAFPSMVTIATYDRLLY